MATASAPVLAGEAEAILHYEHGLNAYQAALNKGMSGNDR